MKLSSSTFVGIAGVHPWRDTTRAPQALPSAPQSFQEAPSSQPYRKPLRKASPAPTTLKTSTPTPLTVMPSSRPAGIGPSKTEQPVGPRFTTITAADCLRTLRRESIVESSPPAIRISSSVPTTRSQAGSRFLIRPVTSSEATNRSSPAPGATSPQSTGR